jgi:hypothetical protein
LSFFAAYFSGCRPSEASRDWGLPVQGRRLPLADLIRFPSDSIRYDAAHFSRLESTEPCGPGGLLLFDYHAFQVDRHGSLAFSRSLGEQRLDNFCVDLVSDRHFMAAVFCRPKNVSHVDPSLQILTLPNLATTTSKGLLYAFTILCSLLHMHLSPATTVFI